MVNVTISKKLLIMAVAFLLLALPATAYAITLFGDVPSGSTHYDGIMYMKNTGISLGCGDGTNYCPDQPVTRAQMGTFLYRMSGNDSATAPNVNADTLDGFNASDLIRSAGAEYPTTSGFPFFFQGTSVAAGASTDFMTVTIDAPVAGALLVNGSLNLYCQGGLLTPTCLQSNGNVYVLVGTTTYDRQYYSLDGGDSTANGASWNSSNSAWVPVSAGTQSVSLRVSNTSGSAGATWVWSGGLNVLFVPFDGTGTTP